MTLNINEEGPLRICRTISKDQDNFLLTWTFFVRQLQAMCQSSPHFQKEPDQKELLKLREYNKTRYESAQYIRRQIQLGNFSYANLDFQMDSGLEQKALNQIQTNSLQLQG